MKHTPGPWTACRMLDNDTGEPITPGRVGEYVRNSMIKSAQESGTMDFLFVLCNKPDGPADVCHVGNGPDGPANARLIAAAPELLAALEHLRALAIGHINPKKLADSGARAAILKATGGE